MCDYCDCRTRPLLAQLGADHERIGVLAARLLRDVEAANRSSARRTVRELAEMLEAHIDREEYDLFPAAHQILDDPAWDRLEAHRCHSHRL